MHEVAFDLLLLLAGIGADKPPKGAIYPTCQNAQKGASLPRSSLLVRMTSIGGAENGAYSFYSP